MRIDSHHHMVPSDYRKALQQAGIDDAGGRAMPQWSPESSLQTMAELDIATAILSVSAPGTTSRAVRSICSAAVPWPRCTPPPWRKRAGLR